MVLLDRNFNCASNTSAFRFNTGTQSNPDSILSNPMVSCSRLISSGSFCRSGKEEGQCCRLIDLHSIHDQSSRHLFLLPTFILMSMSICVFRFITVVSVEMNANQDNSQDETSNLRMLPRKVHRLLHCGRNLSILQYVHRCSVTVTRSTVPCLLIRFLPFSDDLDQYHSCSINLDESYRWIFANFHWSKIINCKQKISRLWQSRLTDGTVFHGASLLISYSFYWSPHNGRMALQPFLIEDVH